MIFRSPKLLRFVGTRMCCVHCGSLDVQAAHRNQGKGMGIKCSDGLIAALCFPEHFEIDQGTRYSRAEKRALMDGYIVETFRRAKAMNELPEPLIQAWEGELAKVRLLEVTA